MALRITQGQMFGSFTNNMNNSLIKLTELNYQSHTQLKVNRPSDDPAAAGLIISSRSSLDRLGLYNTNLSTAKGWLSAIDSTLTGQGSVMSVLSSIQQLAEQAASGTYDKENRIQIGHEIREYFNELISLANQDYGNKYIFGGQKTNTPPYSIGLGVNSNTDTLKFSGVDEEAVKSIQGSFKGDYTINVESADSSSLTFTYTYMDKNGDPVISQPQKTLIKPDGSATLELPGGSITLDTTTDAFKDPLAAGLLNIKVHEPKVSGQTEKTILFQVIGRQEGKGDPNKPLEAQDAIYRCTSDGGKTWTTVTPDDALDSDGKLVLTSPEGVELKLNPDSQVKVVDQEKDNATDNGTWIYIHPTAIYKGDDNDTQVVLGYGNKNPDLIAEANGFFSRDITLKIEEIADGTISFSYSMDDGLSWTKGKTDYDGQNTRLPVPGGFLNLTGDIAAGEQFTIHPHRADINIPISDNSSVTVNLVGKDVFGGQYLDPVTGQMYSVGGDDNLFDVIGNLIAYCETGSQEGVQESLEPLQAVMEKITTQAAIVGGRWNRVNATLSQVESKVYSETDRLSEMEDVDISELMIKISQQQIAYNSVLKSSSMIMQMSLVNFL